MSNSEKNDKEIKGNSAKNKDNINLATSGEKTIESKSKSIKKSKKGKKKKHTILKTILIIFLIGIVVVLGLGIGFIVAIMNGAGSLSISDFEINNYTTTIYDKYGDVYANLYSSENRFYASHDQMSPYLPKAFIAIEDERFETHIGIDIKRTGAAVVNFILRGDSDFGGSTITQQLIKKVTEDDSRSWQRKAREIVRAIQLEQKMTKKQIIELYMNIIYLGEGAYGVETAAHTYFDKSASELTIAECALIAGLAQSPEGRNPYRNPDGAKARQEIVLAKMLELEYITNAEYEEAMNQEIVYTKGTIQEAASNSYFVDAVVDAVITDLMEEKGVTKAMANKMVYSNGLKIYTTVDPSIQKAAEDVYKDENYFKLRTGNYDPELQSAMVIIDYRKGEVVGLVGGTGEKTTLRGLNRATQSARAPGSTMKPLGVYAPGIDSGKLTAAMTFNDVPTTFQVSSTETWTPAGSNRGLTSVRKGIETSNNMVAAKAFQLVGSTISREYLKNFGFTTITNSDVSGGALALGGLTKGMIPIEHAAAYGTIANRGIYLTPKVYTRVVDKDGEALLENVSELREVLSIDSAYVVTNMLRDVITGSAGTGGSASLGSSMPVAGKTGTTNDSKDRWFAGFTPYYVASVWVGYDQQKTINMSGNPAAKIWKAVMSKVHSGLSASNPGSSFDKPSTIVTMEVCADSGLLATELCKNDVRGSRVKNEIFTKDNVPTEYCTMHVKTQVCPVSFKLPNPTCLHEAGVISLVYTDRGYTEDPAKPPKDYNGEVPHTYCTVHYCPKDENGNFIGANDNNNNTNSNTPPSYEEEPNGEDKKNWWD